MGFLLFHDFEIKLAHSSLWPTLAHDVIIESHVKCLLNINKQVIYLNIKKRNSLE